ncbi:hypothetical protein LDENG_00210270 [Lucifuga dentata]|nr:hypothetical protein LDENG_00210270 [Lucifuga dentata]
MQSIPRGERVVIGADFNGHVGAGNRGDEEVMGKFGIQDRNAEGQMVKKWDTERTEESSQEYREMKRKVKVEVAKAKQRAYNDLYARLDSKEGETDLYRLARQRNRDGKDVQQVRVIKDRDGNVLTGEVAVEFLTRLFNEILESERMPEEWRRSVLVPIFKNKGDVQSCGNYRGIKLMSHTMKLWERVVEARLRAEVSISEQQYGLQFGVRGSGYNDVDF